MHRIPEKRNIGLNIADPPQKVQSLVILLLSGLSSTSSGLGALPLHSAGTSSTEGRGEGEVDVLIFVGVGEKEEGRGKDSK